MKFPSKYFSHYEGRAACYELRTCGVLTIRIFVEVDFAETIMGIRIYKKQPGKNLPICRYPTGDEYAKIMRLFFELEERERITRTYFEDTLFIRFWHTQKAYSKEIESKKYHKSFQFKLWREQSKH